MWWADYLSRKNRAMKKNTQDDYVKTSLRIPPSLHAELCDAAEAAGRSLNAEIIARLQVSPPDEMLRRIAAQNQKLQDMVQEIIYAIGPRRR